MLYTWLMAAVQKSKIIPDEYEPISLKFEKEGDDASEDETEEGGFPFWLPSKKTWTLSLCQRIEAGIQDRRSFGFDDRVRYFRDIYESTMSQKNVPWEGCANLRRPQTRSIIDTIHAQVYKAICGVSPYFRVDAESAETVDDAWLIQSGLQSVFTGPIKLNTIIRTAIKDCLIDGTTIIVPKWKLEVQKKKQRVLVDQNFIDMTTLAAKNGDAQAADLLPSIKKLLPQIQKTGQGVWQTISREEVVYDAASVDLVDILNFGMYPASSPNTPIKRLDQCEVVFMREWLTIDNLRHAVKNGELDGDAVEELIATGNKSVGMFVESAGGDRRTYESQGLPTTDTFDVQDTPFEIIKGLVRCDSDNDGLPEWVMFAVARNERILLRAQDYPYFHDRPFFVPLVVLENTKLLYGYSACGILEGLQIELDSIGNQRLDNGTLRNTVSFVKKRGTKWNPETSKFYPGMVWDVDNTDDLKPLTLGSMDQSAFAEEDGVKRFMREVMAVSDTMLAQNPKGDTTLGETELSNQGANLKFDVMIDAISDGLSEMAGQVKDLYGQYMPDSITFNAGTSTVQQWETINRHQMQAKVELHVYGTAQMMNKVLQGQQAEKLVMFAQQSPFVQADLTRRWAAEARFLERGMDIKDYTRFIGTQQDATKMQLDKQKAPPPAPEEKLSVTERRDEVLTLAMAFLRGECSPDAYMKAAQAAAAANAVMLPVPPHIDPFAATETAAGYPHPAGAGGPPPTPGGPPMPPPQAMPPPMPPTPSGPVPGQ